MSRQFEIYERDGFYRLAVNGSRGGNFVAATTLEKALAKLSPDAPEEYVHHTAEVLDGLMGPRQEIDPEAPVTP